MQKLCVVEKTDVGVEIHHQASKAKYVPIWNTRQNLFGKLALLVLVVFIYS